MSDDLGPRDRALADVAAGDVAAFPEVLLDLHENHFGGATSNIHGADRWRPGDGALEVRFSADAERDDIAFVDELAENGGWDHVTAHHGASVNGWRYYAPSDDKSGTPEWPEDEPGMQCPHCGETHKDWENEGSHNIHSYHHEGVANVLKCGKCGETHEEHR